MNTNPIYLVELNKECTAVVTRIDGEPQDGLCGPWPPRRPGESSLQQVRKVLRRSEYIELIPGVLPVACLGDCGGGGGC